MVAQIYIVGASMHARGRHNRRMRHLFLSCTLGLGSIAGCAAPPVSPPVAAAPTPAAAPSAAPAAAAPTAAATTPADGTDEAGAAHAASFGDWLAGFAERARAAGIGNATIQGALLRARWQPEVVRLDRAQPEFTRTPWNYLDNAVSPLRVQQGQRQYQRNAKALQGAGARYGVEPGVLVAIWGMESNYGRNFGSFSTVDALATLAFDGRRRAWAERELLAALTILDQDGIAPERLQGSWAGAMGHTQFLPSVYLAYAVDADGDGRADIWASVPDVAASTANYLASSGWQSGQPVIAEVRLPAGFDYARAELAVHQSSAKWDDEGVRSQDRAPLPALDDASIIAPAGAHGPAILVGANFRALLRYNNSVNYALAVALLARRIEGAGGLAAAWPRDEEPLSRSQIRAMQEALNAQGLQAGTADGVMGPATRAAVRRYQRGQGLPADGYATQQLFEKISQ